MWVNHSDSEPQFLPNNQNRLFEREDWRTFRADRVERPFANGVRIDRLAPAEEGA